MDNYSKHYGNIRKHAMRLLIVLALALSVQLLPLTPFTSDAMASSPPPQSSGCETYGCLYEHCPTHFSRTGEQSECQYGVAYERLPDGPDNRKFVRILWPGHYTPERRGMWDNVAFCESTWRWKYNGGSGFDGGLQFTPSTWRAYGGNAYSNFAWEATPEQQIDIAENVAFYGYGNSGPQGRGAWPNCGHHVAVP